MGANPILIRAFPTNIEQIGPRQLTGRLVPYGEVTNVLDDLPEGPDIYQEGFRQGAFGPQVNTKAPKVIQRIGLVHRHDGGLGYLGPFTALRELPDGLYGDIMIIRSKANDVEDLLSAGVDELSIEFRLPKGNDHTEIDAAGVRWRRRAHLDGVALEPKGAYSQARVLQFRQEIDEQKAADAEADKQKAEEESKADAERQQAEAAANEIKQRAEQEAEARLIRRQQFAELAERHDREQGKQKEMVATYLPSDYRNR
jgi:HK97 family phage prohead protease